MNKINKDFWKYISLGIYGMIGSAGTIFADSFFVSDRLGANGLAAMNLAMFVFGLMNGTGLLFGIGGATRYTIFKARDCDTNANKAFVLSFFSAALLGTLYALSGLLFSEKISLLLGADADTFQMCNIYLKTILCFAPAFVLNHLLMAFVRNDGNPSLSTRAMMTGSLSNIILDYLFMYPFNMGIFGAAVATGISALISISISSLHFISDRNNLKFIRTKAEIKEIFKIASLGASAFITEFSSGIVLVVFNLLILNTAGNVGLAAYSIVANLALMILAIMNGISQGIQPLISRMYGKGDFKTVKYLYYKGTVLTLIIGCAVFILSYIFSADLVHIFNSSNDIVLQTLAEKGIKIYFIGFLFVGANYISAAYFSATERAPQAFTIAVFRGFIGISVTACLLSVIFEMNGIWISFPIVEVITILISVIFLKSKKVFNNTAQLILPKADGII